MYDLAHKICPQCEARVVENHRFCPSCGSDLSETPACDGDPYVGVVIEGRYRIEHLLGAGAMGRVYRAEQKALRKSFAVKILSPHLTNDPDSQARFANEAYNAASLNHPNVVSVVDYGRTDDGVTYLVMEHIEGQSLEQIICDGFPLTGERIADLMLQILAALTEAHGLAILHRDLKPENILVQSVRDRGELLKVLDFGIAKLMDDAPTTGPGGQARPGLTSQGAVCGTPEYMSPEQACGLKLDQRSDLYSVGVILYQMLTGRPPFESEIAVEILHRHIHEDPKPPSEVLGREPEPLDAVCLRAMAKDRGDRFADATEFSEAVVAATRAATQALINCGHCGERMRASDRFCATCGTPTPDCAAVPVRRVERRSTRALRQATGEATAEVLLRALPSRLVGAAATGLIAAGEARLINPKPGLYTQVLAGPAGSGKTRLIDELADRGEQSAWVVVSVGSEPTGAMKALWPIRQAVGRVLGLAPEGPHSAAEIGRAAKLMGLSYETLPGLHELFGVGPGVGVSGTTVEYAVRRRECFTSAVQVLLEGASGRPLLLTFDDVDRWDAPSRRVLQQLVRARSDQPVLILIATAEAERDWLCSPVVELPRLERDEILRWAQGLAHGESVGERLASHAPLTPFELELALRSAPADGQPIDFEQAVNTWLEGLTAPERQVLELCSVLGERVELDDIDTLWTVDPGGHVGEFAQHLGALELAGLLVARGGRAWAFRSRQIREHVRDTIARERARHLHHEAAQRTELAQLSATVRALFLLRAQPGKVQDTAGRLQTVELIEALREAAVVAVAAFDDPKAVRLLRTALKACRRLPDDDRLYHEANLITELIAPFCFTGRVDEAIDTIRKLLRSQRAAELESDLNRSLGQCLTHKQDWQGAIDAYQRALGPLIALGRRPALLQLYADLARAWVALDNRPRALAELTEGLDMCTLGDGPRAAIDVSIWRYLLTISSLHERAGDLRTARVWAEHALYQAERRNEDLGLMRAHEVLGHLLVTLEQAMLAEQHVGRGLELARKLGDRKTSAGLLLLRGELRNTAGRVDEAQRCVHEALRLAELLEWELGIARAHAALKV